MYVMLVRNIPSARRLSGKQRSERQRLQVRACVNCACPISPEHRLVMDQFCPDHGQDESRMLEFVFVLSPKQLKVGSTMLNSISSSEPAG